MSWRWAWWALLASVAAVAAFAQLDRASQRRPELVPAVPPPFRSFAQQHAALMALAGGDPRMARAAAERLVRVRPMPAEHLYLLALADLRGGDFAGYARAFEQSTARGWRARPVQQAATRAALDAGNVEAAANRIAALWALDARDPAIPVLTRSLLATERGRAAFAAKLAGTEVWQDAYLQRALDFGAAGHASAVIDQAIHKGARFDPATLERFRSAADFFGAVAARKPSGSTVSLPAPPFSRSQGPGWEQDYPW